MTQRLTLAGTLLACVLLGPAFTIGELESAAGDYGKVIELNPQSAEAYAGRGILRLYQKKDAEAKADFDQCLKINPAMKESLNRRIVYAKYQRAKKKR